MPWLVTSRSVVRGPRSSVSTEVTPTQLLAAIEGLREEVRQLRSSIPTTLVDVQAAADYMGVSPRTVRRLVHDDAIPYRRVGRHVRFDLARLAPKAA
jgi:excisionase family DNA binding protein